MYIKKSKIEVQCTLQNQNKYKEIFKFKTWFK